MVEMVEGKPVNRCPKCGETYDIKKSIIEKAELYTESGEKLIVTLITCQKCYEVEAVQVDTMRSAAVLSGIERMIASSAAKRGKGKNVDPFLVKRYKRENSRLDGMRKANTRNYEGKSLYDKEGNLRIKSLTICVEA